jgi:transcriptional regulator with XRE-family HTH domain
MRTNIGAVIKRLREASRFTQDQFGMRVGTDKGNISRIESGKQEPEIARLEAIATTLGTTLSAIFAEAEGDKVAVPALTPSEAALLDDFQMLLLDDQVRLLAEVARLASAGRQYQARFGASTADDARVRRTFPRAPISKPRTPSKK